MNSDRVRPTKLNNLKLSFGKWVITALSTFMAVMTIAAFSVNVNAATFVVNTTTDTVDAAPGNGMCADAVGMCSLRAAITEANALSGADIITLPAGTYTTTIAGTNENLNANGDFDIASSLTINGAGSGTTFVQANAAPNSGTERVFHIISGGTTLDINNLTIQNGNVTGTNVGGGLNSSVTSTVALTNVVITNNRVIPTAANSNAFGGGISSTAGTLTLTGCTVSNNSSLGNGSGLGLAGGIYNQQAILNVNNSSVTGNIANGLHGGIRTLASTGGAAVTNITNSTISNNKAQGMNPSFPGEGGGLVNIAGSTFAATTTITGSTISGNQALVSNAPGANTYGGGIESYNTSTGAATVNITNSTISGNSAAFAGGIYSDGSAATMNLNFSTVASNAAQTSGGGLYQDSTALGLTILKNSIVADNTAGTSGPDIFGTITSQDYNHVENTAGGSFTPMGNDITGSDPGLGSLANNGGPTLTHIPGPSSAVLNTIPIGTNGCGTMFTLDQRVFARPFGSGCDKGSVEFGSFAVSPTNTPTSTPTNSATNTATPSATTTGTPLPPSGGPLVLMGIDAEDAGPGGHGPIEVYVSVTNSVYNTANNGGTGILVIGGGKLATDDVTTFWNAVSTGTGLSVTYVNGTNISTVSFTPFRMIAVVSDVTNTASGGLTTTEHNALVARSATVASFINGGGGLLGFSSEFANPFAYLSAVGVFGIVDTTDYQDITPTAAGITIGITDALDVCCWHQDFTSFPPFLSLLATNVSTGRAAAVGGVNSFIGTIQLSPSSANLLIGNNHTLTALVAENNNPVPNRTVTLTVLSGPNNGLTLMSQTDANGTATFNYVGSIVGTDTLRASYVDSQSMTRDSNQVTATWVGPTDTPTNTPTATPTFTPTAMFTSTATATSTFTPTASFTPTATATSTFTPTASFTATATATSTFTPTASFTATPTATSTFTPTASFTATASATSTFTPTASFTPTFTPTATATSTFTPTRTVTNTPTATNTPSSTPTGSPTPTQGAFVIGDLNAAVGENVTFWSPKWANVNRLSGGAAPDSFKGWAVSSNPAPPVCGGTWTSTPGASADPPKILTGDITVFVSSNIARTRATISGNILQMVVVHVNESGPSLGHPFTGTVVSVICAPSVQQGRMENVNSVVEWLAPGLMQGRQELYEP